MHRKTEEIVTGWRFSYWYYAIFEPRCGEPSGGKPEHVCESFDGFSAGYDGYPCVGSTKVWRSWIENSKFLTWRRGKIRYNGKTSIWKRKKWISKHRHRWQIERKARGQEDQHQWNEGNEESWQRHIKSDTCRVEWFREEVLLPAIATSKRKWQRIRRRSTHDRYSKFQKTLTYHFVEAQMNFHVVSLCWLLFALLLRASCCRGQPTPRCCFLCWIILSHFKLGLHSTALEFEEVGPLVLGQRVWRPKGWLHSRNAMEPHGMCHKTSRTSALRFVGVFAVFASPKKWCVPRSWNVFPTFAFIRFIAFIHVFPSLAESGILCRWYNGIFYSSRPSLVSDFSSKFRLCITRVTRGLRPAKCIGDSFPDGIRLPLFGQDCMEHLRNTIRTDLNRHIDETNETIWGHTDSYLDNYGWCSLAGWKAVSITPSAGVRRVGSCCQDSQESDWT